MSKLPLDYLGERLACPLARLGSAKDLYYLMPLRIEPNFVLEPRSYLLLGALLTSRMGLASTSSCSPSSSMRSAKSLYLPITSAAVSAAPKQFQSMKRLYNLKRVHTVKVILGGVVAVYEFLDKGKQ